MALGDEPSRFPSPTDTDEDGLLALGGRLDVDWLVDAYRHGIFPWPVGPGAEHLAWWSPDPRAIIPLESFHVSRRLLRTVRSGRFHLSFDAAFGEVVEGCATAGDRRFGTWITPEMAVAYRRLHEVGLAHSVEAWRNGRLVGGVYGVALGAMFAGESMFHFERDASKAALVALVERLRERGYRLFDIQQLTPHTARFGAVEIARTEYLARLHGALGESASFA